MFLKRVILPLICIIIYSCQEKTTRGIESQVAFEISDYLISEYLLNTNYSSENNLHVALYKLNDSTYTSYAAFNRLTDENSQAKQEKLKINGVRIIIYYHLSDDNEKLSGPFFVPDSKNWTLLA